MHESPASESGIGDDGDAGHQARGIGSEEMNHRGNLMRLAHAVQAAGADVASPLRASDIEVIDPVAAWVPDYDRVFSAMHEDAIAPIES